MEKEKTTPGESREVSSGAYYWILWGIFLGVLKLAWSFFPFFNLVDMLVFGSIGAFISRRYESGKMLRLLFSVLPSLILISAIIINLGLNKVLEGIGIGWALSLIIIPGSAFLGSYLQDKFG